MWHATAWCVFSQMKDAKTYQMGFSFCRLGHATRGDFGPWGAQGVKKFKHSYVAYQIDGDESMGRTKCK